jgi:hypothetical protein
MRISFRLTRLIHLFFFGSSFRSSGRHLSTFGMALPPLSHLDLPLTRPLRPVPSYPVPPLTALNATATTVPLLDSDGTDASAAPPAVSAAVRAAQHRHVFALLMDRSKPMQPSAATASGSSDNSAEGIYGTDRENSCTSTNIWFCLQAKVSARPQALAALLPRALIPQ